MNYYPKSDWILYVSGLLNNVCYNIFNFRWTMSDTSYVNNKITFAVCSLKKKWQKIDFPGKLQTQTLVFIPSFRCWGRWRTIVKLYWNYTSSQYLHHHHWFYCSSIHYVSISISGAITLQHNMPNYKTVWNHIIVSDSKTIFQNWQAIT